MLTPFEIKAILDLSDLALMHETQSLAREERQTTLKLLHHLREVSRRRLFAVSGYPSLFAYLTGALSYSEAAAQRRIEAMRLLTDLPEAQAKEVEAKLESGELSLSVVAQAQTFFRQEAKLEQPLGQAEKLEILHSLTGKTTREAERELLQKTSQPEAHFSERVKPTGATHAELRVLVSTEVLSDLEKLKGLLAHRHPNLSYGELLGVLSKMALEKLDPAREPRRRKKQVQAVPGRLMSKAQISELRTVEAQIAGTQDAETLPARMPTIDAEPARSSVSLPAPEEALRHGRRPRKAILAALRRAVFRRDGVQCTYRDPQSGRVCGSRHRLELDHLRAHALGGADRLENLAVRCFQHNQRHAIQDFGLSWMERSLRHG